MRRHHQDLQPMAEMNVTNLIDTAFVLLIAFMLVAPSIKHGLELDLPQVRAGNLDANAKKSVTVVIQKRALEEGQDRIYLEDRRLTPEELTQELQRQKMLFPKMDVLVEGDKSSSFEGFARALAAIQAAGIENIGIITELPPAKEKP